MRIHYPKQPIKLTMIFKPMAFSVCLLYMTFLLHRVTFPTLRSFWMERSNSSTSTISEDLSTVQRVSSTKSVAAHVAIPSGSSSTKSITSPNPPLNPNASSFAHYLKIPSSRNITASSTNALSKHSKPQMNRQNLRRHLNFSPNTTLNFMHFHKTGGNAIKFALHDRYHNATLLSGYPMLIQDACYKFPKAGGLSKEDDKSWFRWRCDWDRISTEMSPAQRASLILTFGHQFLPAISTLLPSRSIRSFTVLRHPLHRKLSFFFHFVVRAHGRSQNDVSISEIQSFLLHETGSTGLDAGPNYYAGRLLASGVQDDRFHVAQNMEDGDSKNMKWVRKWFFIGHSERENMVALAKQKLNKMVFVGLQSQPAANECMLRKTLSLFDESIGIGKKRRILKGEVDEANSGGYETKAEDVWETLTQGQRREFWHREWADLRIYEHAVELFYKHVRLFECEEHVGVDS